MTDTPTTIKPGAKWYGSQIEGLRIRRYVSVVEWAEKNFRLTTAYAVQGMLTLFAWQREPANAITTYDEVIFIAPVQTGKSMLGEAITGYIVDNTTLNVMITYSKKEVVEDVFDERLKPFVREIPAIRRYWSGAEDDLTKRRIKLTHLIIRIASAAVRSDLATHNAGFVYGVELAKWPKKDFDPVRMLFGRTQASRMVGKQVKALFETSPIYVGDKSYVEAHRPGTLFLLPYFPCPYCGEFQPLIDSQVKERSNKKGEFDHDPERIRAENAAFYECRKCRGQIKDEHRADMMERVVWAAPEIKRGKLKQTAEVVDMHGKIAKRKRARRVVYNWNRLVDVTWLFAECLATYFEALNSADPEALKTYRNEDMADWVKLSAKRFEDTFLASKKQKYKQYGNDAYVPDGVRIMLIGIDTQDNGFYFVVRGFGLNLESWLVREGFIHCDMNDDRFQNPGNVFQVVSDEIHRFPYAKRNKNVVPILFGYIDRGGHRARDVDYIVDHMANMEAYIGTPSKQAALIVRKGRFWFGHTENLSRIVQKQMESSLWHIPDDITREYSTQIANQYDEEYIDVRGNTKKRWVTKDPDHFRDCENYIVALLYEESMQLQTQLMDSMTADELEKLVHEARRPETEEERIENRRTDVSKPEAVQSSYLKELTDGMESW